MYICSQKLLSVSLREYSVINRPVPNIFMLDIEYSVITSDVIKSFDCISYFARKDLSWNMEIH